MYNFKNSKNLQFEKFAIRKILKICNMRNTKNLQFKKFQKCTIWKIRKICSWENSKNVQFKKFQKLAIRKIRKIFALENSKNFLNFMVCKILKFLKLYNFEKYQIFKIHFQFQFSLSTFKLISYNQLIIQLIN